MDDINELLNAATKSGNLTDCCFDNFLVENGFDENDLSERILMEDIYFFYSCYYYIKHRKLPHRYQFTAGSVVAQMYRIRQRRGKKLPWGLKVSKRMKDSFLKFQGRSDKWARKLKSILNGKKSHLARKVNKRELEQFAILLPSQD